MLFTSCELKPLEILIMDSRMHTQTYTQTRTHSHMRKYVCAIYAYVYTVIHCNVCLIVGVSIYLSKTFDIVRLVLQGSHLLCLVNVLVCKPLCDSLLFELVHARSVLADS